MEYTTIGEACTLHARIGWQGLTKSEYLDEGDYYLVTGVDFNNGHIAFDTCHFVTKERFDQDQHIQLKVNDVLVTKDGTIGKVAFLDRPIDKPATLNSGVFVVRPKNPDLLLPEYLMIMLMSNNFSRFIEQIKVGCTIAHLNQEKFLRYQFPLPPVTEQKHIIEVYYSATDIIEKRQRQLRVLDTLIKARFVEMFGAYNADCCSRRIGDYAQVLGGYAFKSDEFIQDAIPVIRISNINEGQIIPDYTVCFSEQFWLSNPKFRAVSGDILMAMSGATTGKAGILRSDERLLINQRVACIRAKEGISLPEFIYAMTQLSWMYDLIQDKSAGCAQPNISGKQIENMPIPKATYVQQKEFAAFVSRVDKSKVIVQQALDKAQMLFDSLMQQYFG